MAISRTTLSLRVCSLAFACLLGGCGGGGSSGSGDVSVVDLSADTRVLSVGSGTVVAVDITFDADRVTGGETFHAVVRLPSELRYLASSAEIDGFTSVDDNSVSPIISNCASGEQFLAFDFSRNDLLRAANPSGDADMRLNMTVNAVALSAGAVLEAAAEEDLPPYACGQPFTPDETESIQIQ